MKRVAAFTLLVAASFLSSVPSNAQDFGVAEYARQSQKTAKKQEKISKKANRKQRKAWKKYAKAQRKSAKRASRHSK
jgi:hypothetical protein